MSDSFERRLERETKAAYDRLSAGFMEEASARYDAVQQAMRDRAGKTSTGISYPNPETGKMEGFRRKGYRPASSITVNGKTFSRDDVYKARAAVREGHAKYRERADFRDAMIGLANPNDPKGQKLIKSVNAWFDSGKEISERLRGEFGNVLKGRYAKIQDAASKMKPGDYLDFRKEQETRVGAGTGPEDSPGAGTPQASARSGRGSVTTSQQGVGGPQGRSVSRPFTGNYATGIDRSESRAREQAEHERRQYLWSGRGQRDYWQSRLQDTMQRKEADDARRMHYDLLKLMATSRKYGINLDEAPVDTSALPGPAPRPASAPKPARNFSSASKYWLYKDKPDVRTQMTQGVA